MALGNLSYEARNRRKWYISYGVIAVIIIIILVVFFTDSEDEKITEIIDDPVVNNTVTNDSVTDDVVTNDAVVIKRHVSRYVIDAGMGSSRERVIA